MPRGIGFLKDQAIRMRRTKWPDANMLAHELWTILGSLEAPIDKVTTTDEDGNPIDVPQLDIPELDLGDFDLDHPENPSPTVPEVEQGEPDPNTGETPVDTTTTKWHSASFPGQVLSRTGGANFSVRIFPRGFLDASAARTVSAQLTDATLAEDIEDGAWVTVFLFASYEASTSTFGGITTGQVQTGGFEYLFNFPGAAVGGKLAKTTSTVSGISDSGQPGTGTARIRNRNPETGDWEDGETVTVYNSVSGDVANDKDVQLKRIDGVWFVDVEDCGGDDDNSIINE